MDNYIQPGDSIELTAPGGGVVSGTPYKIGQLLVIAAVTAAAGAKFNGHTTGVFKITKAGSQAWTEGALVYWDNTAKVFTTVATSNLLAGVATAAVAGGAGDTTGYVRLNGHAQVDGAT